MKIRKKLVLSALWGVLYAAFAILLSQALLRSLGFLMTYIGAASGLEPKLVSHIAQALDSLKNAVIRSPWLIFLPVGALAGSLLSWIPRKCRWITITLAVLMLIPCIALALLLSEVNSVLVIHLLCSALPLLAAL